MAGQGPPGSRPGGLRRPLWFARPVKPQATAYAPVSASAASARRRTGRVRSRQVEIPAPRSARGKDRAQMFGVATRRPPAVMSERSYKEFRRCAGGRGAVTEPEVSGTRRRGRSRVAERSRLPEQRPFTQPRLRYAPTEVVSADELESIHGASLRVLVGDRHELPRCRGQGSCWPRPAPTSKRTVTACASIRRW